MKQILFLLFLSVFLTQGIKFNLEIKAKSGRCFKENLPPNTHVIGEAMITSSTVPNFRIYITDSLKYVIFEKSLTPALFRDEMAALKATKRTSFPDMGEVQLDELVYNENRASLAKIRFAFSTQQSEGQVSICLTNLDTINNSFDFEFRHGIDARDYSNIAKKQNLKPAETDILKIEDFVKQMKSTAENIWVKESHKLEMSESFNNSLVWTSVFGIIVILVFGCFQYFIIRNYFKQKKLI